jgi:hypothetical protein
MLLGSWDYSSNWVITWIWYDAMLRVGAARVPHAGKCCKVILRNVALGTWKENVTTKQLFCCVKSLILESWDKSRSITPKWVQTHTKYIYIWSNITLLPAYWAVYFLYPWTYLVHRKWKLVTCKLPPLGNTWRLLKAIPKYVGVEFEGYVLFRWLWCRRPRDTSIYIKLSY